MFDERERLRESAALCRLLTEYVESGGADIEAWQDRRMHLAGVTSTELVALHGELIAYGWIEQNTGSTGLLKPGVTAACYRPTAEGRIVLQQVRDGWDADEAA